MFDKKAYMKEYQQRPEAKARKRERRQCPEAKEKEKEKEYKQRPEVIAREREHYEELKRRAHKILKDKCALCEGKENLCVHERKGNKHPTSRKAYLLVLKFPDKFALLCSSCHKRIHWIMKKRGFTFKQVLQYKDFLFGERSSEARKKAWREEHKEEKRVYDGKRYHETEHYQ